MLLRAARKPALVPSLDRSSRPYLAIYASPSLLPVHSPDVRILQDAVGEAMACSFHPDTPAKGPAPSEFLLALFLAPAQLDVLADQVLSARREGRPCTLLIAQRPEQLLALGRWLEQRANSGRLAGIRLIVESSVAEVAQSLPARLSHCEAPNVLRTPLTPEIENGPLRNFYVFSPSLQALVARLKAFADNGIQRACLLGGPGSGKTSLAYYFYLARAQGQFVSVNLLAENTHDKAAIKSLLCGHVAGAFPGAGARTGAFTQARDGVCFIDESHDISGAVMEVLMEALDNGQYLPYGATSKRQIECAIVFATNRSWNYLQNAVNLDEFTRLGAALLQVPPLAEREEDLIAVAAAHMARLAANCKTWRAPEGISADAWLLLRRQPWRGNIRGLLRVLETSFVDTAAANLDGPIPARLVQAGLELWEPAQHASHALYGGSTTA